MSAVSDRDDRDVEHDPASKTAAHRQIILEGNSVQSAELFGGAREITIVHRSENYRLRLTSQNKLILTK